MKKILLCSYWDHRKFLLKNAQDISLETAYLWGYVLDLKRTFVSLSVKISISIAEEKQIWLVIAASAYLDQILQLWRVHAGVIGQEVQFFCENGQLLLAFIRLLQSSEHRRPDDEVKHHQEEDGWYGFPPHDRGPGVALVIVRSIQHHWFGRERQARLGVVGGRLWVKKVRCGHWKKWRWPSEGQSQLEIALTVYWIWIIWLIKSQAVIEKC